VGAPLKEWDVKISRGILTGCNEAFIIDDAKRQELIGQDPLSAEIIRPILRGRDIKRYSVNWAGLYLITTHNGVPEKGIPKINIAKYSAVRKHLESYWKHIESRADQGDSPYHLRSCAYMEDFSKQKIIWGDISDSPKFALDADGVYSCTNTAYFMTGNALDFIFCYLNSPLSEHLFSKIGSSTGVGTTRWQTFTIERLLVPRITPKEELEFSRLISKMKQGGLPINDINRCIYALCDLSRKEIEFIENSASSS